MEIILDVDGPVADFIGPVNKILGVDASFANSHDYFLRHTNKLAVLQALRSTNFWQKQPVVQGAHEGIKFLRDNKHKIIWCTKPYEECFGWYDTRKEWLERHFNFRYHNEPLIPTANKEYVQGNIFIDDSTEHFTIYSKRNPTSLSFLFDTTANRHFQTNYRVNWWDIMNNPLFKRKE